MREIKFRVFNTKEKKMITHFKGARIDYALQYWETHQHVSEPMQFTGKKDKNGNEIFEGDILRVKEHPDFPVFGGVGFVFWDNEEQSYFYGVNDGWSDLLCTPEEKQLEVIGNIYENPELLEETKK